MNEVSLEKIINLVVREVVSELEKRGVKIVASSQNAPVNTGGSLTVTGIKTKTEKIDMTGYKTPILTERHIDRLHELTGEIIIPMGTVITPKAREVIKQKNLSIRYE